MILYNLKIKENFFMYSDYYDSIAKVAETDKEVADAMALE